MSHDIVKELGYLTLGSRLKRIAENLQSDVQTLMQAKGLAFQPGQFPLLAALDQFGDMTIGQLVQTLGVTQPGVTRHVKQLEALGLVAVAMSDTDARTKHVSLTPKAKSIVQEARDDLWPAIDRALADICNDQSSALLGNLDHLEHELKQRPLKERADQNMQGEPK